MIKISPSILQADFMQLGQVIKKLEEAKADMIHIDVMDGNFVGTITFGPKMVKDIKNITLLPLDVHLMIVNPKKHIDSFADAGADIITIHQETTQNLVETLQDIKRRGIKCSVSIKPNTDIDTLLEALPIVDMVLVMTVEPGEGGQPLIEATLDKVRKLKKIKEEKNYLFDIQVDGGINESTKDMAIAAGANVLVAGSAITDSKNYKKTISILKGEK